MSTKTIDLDKMWNGEVERDRAEFEATEEADRIAARMFSNVDDPADVPGHPGHPVTCRRRCCR